MSQLQISSWQGSLTGGVGPAVLSRITSAALLSENQLVEVSSAAESSETDADGEASQKLVGFLIQISE